MVKSSSNPSALVKLIGSYHKYTARKWNILSLSIHLAV